MLDGAIGQMKAILRGSEDNAIATFNTSHRAIKDAIKRAVELEQVLNEPRLHDLERARKAQGALWGFLSQESDISDDLRTRASSLEDLLARETFFKELPSIEQHTKALETEYEQALRRGARRPRRRVHQGVRQAHQDAGLVGDRRGPAAPPRRALRARAEARRRARADPAASRGPRRLRGAPARGRRRASAHHRRRARRHRERRQLLRGRHRDRGAARSCARRRARGVRTSHRRRQEGHRSVGACHDDLRTPRSQRPSRATSASTTGTSSSAARVADICRYEIVEGNAIRAQVTFRAKSPKSLEGKLRKFAQTGKKSMPTVDAVFDQVRDLAAVRVATYVQTRRGAGHRRDLQTVRRRAMATAVLIDRKDKHASDPQQLLPSDATSRSTCRRQDIVGTYSNVDGRPLRDPGLQHDGARLERDRARPRLQAAAGDALGARAEPSSSCSAIGTRSGDGMISQPVRCNGRRNASRATAFTDVYDFVARAPSVGFQASTSRRTLAPLFEELQLLRLNTPDGIQKQIGDLPEPMTEARWRSSRSS